MVQKISAMGEDTKYQIIFQDLIRRLMNTSESLEPKYKIEVVDEYCDKLVRCGYSKDQVSRILINGITGYWPDLDQTLSKGSWEHIQQTTTVTTTFVQATFVLGTFVHISNISAVTGPIWIKL